MVTKNRISVIVLFIIVFLFSLLATAEDTYSPSSADRHNPNLNEISFDNSGESASVDLFSGAATYTYPLELPPAVNGLQPFLALSYNHHRTYARSSLVGSAWSFNENYIQRDNSYTRTNTQDDNFILILNGISAKLVYVPSEGSYHTKDESYLSIKKVAGGSNERSEYWIVKTKDGTAYRFGYNRDSELVSNQESYVSRWSLDLVNDTHNNQIVYSYTENPNQDVGTVYPKEIRYGNNILTFSYDYTLLPKRFFYSQGYVLQQTGVIKEIVIRNSNNLVRKYSLSYSKSGNIVLLQSLTEVGSDGTSTLPPTRFSYLPETRGWSENGAWQLPYNVPTGSAQDTGVRFVDYNWDGLTDIIQLDNSGNLNYWLNKGNGWNSVQSRPYFLTGGITDSAGKDLGLRFTDINGDTKTDIMKLLAGDTTVRSLLVHNGNGWERSSLAIPQEINFINISTISVPIVNEWWTRCNPSSCPSSFSATDLSCDDSHHTCTRTCVRYKCWTEDGDFIGTCKGSRRCCPSGTIPDEDEDTRSCNYEHHSETTYQVQTVWRDLGVHMVDVNGDGKSDIVKVTPTERKTWINKNWFFELDNDWLLPPTAFFFSSAGEDLGVRFADLNGDGLIDIAKSGPTGQAVWINMGKGWIQDNLWTFPYGVTFSGGNVRQGLILVDVNGDTLPDLVQASNNIRSVWINNGRGWTQDSTWILPTTLHLDDFSSNLEDVNGDGAIDIIQAPEVWDVHTYLNNKGRSNLLFAVTTSFGGTISFDYDLITKINNKDTNGVSQLGFSGWVVSSKTISNGMSGQASALSTIRYNYTGGMYEPNAREFRGFAQTEETFPNNKIIKHYFSQDEARKGREYQTEIYEGTSRLQKTEFSWEASTLNGYNIVKLSQQRETEYSPNNQKIIQTNYGYDSFGNVILINHLGEIFATTDDWIEQLEYSSNPNSWIVDRLKRHTILKGDQTKLQEDLFYYDNNAVIPTKGDLTDTSSWLNGGSAVVTNYQYDSFGNLVQETDPKGRITSYTYDNNHLFPIKVTNAKNQNYNLTFNSANGNILSLTDPNSYRTTYEYDTFGRKTKEIYPYDSSSSPTITWTYSFDGTAPEMVKTSLKRDANNQDQSWIYYDGLGNVIQEKKSAENNQQTVVDYFYDSLLRNKAQSNNYFIPKQDNYITQTSPKTEYQYDTRDRLIRITNPDGTTKNIQYDLWKTTVSDENNHRKEYLSDAFGRIISITEVNGNERYTTVYNYDQLGNVLSITDNQNNQWRYTYDTLGRVVTLADPDLGTWRYQYDAANNLILQTNANNVAIQMQYDELNRPIQKKQSNSIISYTYDAPVKGTLSQITSPGETVSYDYDQRLRVIKETKNIDGTRFVIEKTYDHADNLIQEKVNNEIITYTFGSQGLNNLNGMVSFTYSSYDLPLQKTYTNGLITQFTYNAQNQRLDKILIPNKQELRYRYDTTGNIVEINDARNNKVTTMTYDEIDRLKSTQRSGAQNFTTTYTYDSIGNMLTAVLNNNTYRFTYGNTPVHAPKSFLQPTCRANEVWQNSLCIAQTGCQYNASICNSNQTCSNNFCVLKTGCSYNHPVCAVNQDCVNNVCQLKTGCNYNNPACGSNYNCVNNICILRQSCTQNSSICNSNQTCSNNVCVLKTGCSYNNPSCNANQDCVNNVCQARAGCNPACNSNQECVNNQCRDAQSCGAPLGTNSWCYQESANVSTACAGLNNGTYSHDNYNLYVNYSKPINSLEGKFRVKHGNSDTNNASTLNLTIPTECWNKYTDKIRFKLYSDSYPLVGGGGSSNIYCEGNYGWVSLNSVSCIGQIGSANSQTPSYWNDGNWSTYSYFSGRPGYWGNNNIFYSSYNRCGMIYEEAMWWQIQETSICDNQHNCINNVCTLKQGCTYNNPSCTANQDCVNNVCQLKTGCQYDNPSCGSNYDCVNNACVLKTGCNYNNPTCNPNEDCVNNVCQLKAGCQYNASICNLNQTCSNNICVLKTGCSYNNPSCSANQQCVNNNCEQIEVQQTGCQYNNPSCSANQDCINNQCQNRVGCQYNNPACIINEDCVNNVCQTRVGCTYNNPSCANNEDCINNVCQLKTGCNYNNPSCPTDQQCINNNCEPIEVQQTGCSLNNPSCQSYERCFDNNCIQIPGLEPSGSFDPNKDLKAVSLKRHPVVQNNLVTYEFIIKNTGGDVLRNIPWIIETFPAMQILASGTVAQLRSGNEMALYPAFPENCDFLVAVVDPNHIISEKNESNNGVYLEQPCIAQEKSAPKSPSSIIKYSTSPLIIDVTVETKPKKESSPKIEPVVTVPEIKITPRKVPVKKVEPKIIIPEIKITPLKKEPVKVVEKKIVIPTPPKEPAKKTVIKITPKKKAKS